MIKLVKVLAKLLSGQIIEAEFGKELTGKMLKATSSVGIDALGKKAGAPLDEDTRLVAETMTEDLMTFLRMEGASEALMDRIDDGLARGLTKASPAKAVISALYEEVALRRALSAAVDIDTFDPSERGYVNRAIEKLTQTLIQGASSLKGYKEARDEKLLRTQETIRANTRKLVHAPDEAWDSYAKQYSEAVGEELNYVEILGLGEMTRGEREAKLSTAYLSLTIGERKDGSKASEFWSILAECLFDNSLLVVEGGAGSGKSTLLRWACTHINAYKVGFDIKSGRTVMINGDEVDQRFSTHYLHDRDFRGKFDFDGAAPLPFLIRLRAFADGELPEMNEWPRHICPALDAAPDGFTRRAIEKSRAIFMFDGVDEIPEGAAREKALNTIASYARRYPKTPLILTSRPGAFGPKEYTGFERAETHAVDDLNATQQTAFVRKWHSARELSPSASQSENYPELAEALLDRIRETPALARIATNPLLCAAICALHEREPQTLPTDERGLCERLSVMLLRRDLEPGRVDPLAIDEFPVEYQLSPERRRQLLAHLAMKMVKRGRSQLDWVDAAPLVKKGLSELGEPNLDPDIMVKALAKRSPPLRDCSGTDGGEAIEFLHNRFKEYLASTWFISEEEDGELIHHAEKEAYAETLVMAAAATDRKKFAARLVGGIMDRAENEEGAKQRRAMRVLALRAALAAPVLPEELQSRRDKLQTKLLPPRSMAEAKALALAGDAVSKRLTQKSKPRSATESARCIRSLSLIGTSKARNALMTYSEDTRMTVLEELGRHLDPADLPALWVPDNDGSLSFSGGVSQFIFDLQPLAHLKQLKSISLFGTRVTDLSPLADLKKLEIVDLSFTPVTDISPLFDLPNLKVLYIIATSIDALGPLEDRAGLEIHQSPG